MIECKAVIPFGVARQTVELIERDLTAAFGGLQMHAGVGLWCDPDQGGRVISERIITMICAVPSVDDFETFQEIVERHCRAAGERYLYVARQDGHAEIVPLTEEKNHD